MRYIHYEVYGINLNLLQVHFHLQNTKEYKENNNNNIDYFHTNTRYYRVFLVKNTT